MKIQNAQQVVIKCPHCGQSIVIHTGEIKLGPKEVKEDGEENCSGDPEPVGCDDQRRCC